MSYISNKELFNELCIIVGIKNRFPPNVIFWSRQYLKTTDVKEFASLRLQDKDEIYYTEYLTLFAKAYNECPKGWELYFGTDKDYPFQIDTDMLLGRLVCFDISKISRIPEHTLPEYLKRAIRCHDWMNVQKGSRRRGTNSSQFGLDKQLKTYCNRNPTNRPILTQYIYRVAGGKGLALLRA